MNLFTNFQHFINTISCSFFINESRYMNISHCGNFDVSRQYLQYFAFCINKKSWEKFKFLYSVIDPLKKGITNMNKSKIRREIEINGISVISLTKMRIVEENFSFACVYDVFTIINGNEMSWFSNKHCIKYTMIQVFTDP